MKTRQEALDYGLSFPNTYQEAPFHDPNWQLVRVKDSKKVFLWTYERQWFYQLKCQGISCMARLLERCLPIGHPRLAPEQGQLEYHHSRWQHT